MLVKRLVLVHFIILGIFGFAITYKSMLLRLHLLLIRFNLLVILNS